MTARSAESTSHKFDSGYVGGAEGVTGGAVGAGAHGEVRTWRIWPWALLVGSVAFVTFAPSIGYDWVGWDDEAYVTTSPLMSAPDGLRLIWASTEAEQYYPLTFTLLRIQYQLWGRDPTGYHATCVLLHAINAVLLLWTLWALVRCQSSSAGWHGLAKLGRGAPDENTPKRRPDYGPAPPERARAPGLTRGIAVAVALLFAVHPMQAMSVAWVAQQKNLLSCLFVLLTLVCWMRFRTGDKWRWYLASLLAFAAALLSKTAILTLPLAILGLDTLVLRRRAMSTVVRTLPMFVLAFAALGLTVLFEKPFVEEVSIPPLSERLLIAGTAVWFYVLKLLCPVGLTPIYSLWSVSATDWRWWLSLVLLVGTIVLLWRGRRKIDRYAMYGLVHFLVFLLPVLGLVPFGNLGETYVSDHYVYIACIGFFVVVSLAGRALLAKLKLRSAAQGGVLGVIVVTLLVLTLFYAPVFSNAESMWTRTLEGNPNCFTAHAGLGQCYANEDKWSAAISSYEKALDLRPDHLAVRHALGRAQLRGGQLPEAEKTLLSVVQADDKLPGPWLDLAHIAERTGRYEEAINDYLRALDLDPHHARTRIGLAQLYLGLSRTGEAEAQFEAAVRDAPDEALGYLGLATCRRGAGRSSEAVHILEGGLEKSPENVALQNMLARILATDPDDTVRNGARAVQVAKEAERLTAGRDCLVLDTLAAAYAETGDFPQAVTTAERAAALAESQGYRVTAEQLRNVAGHYRGSNVLRETKTKLTLQ